MDYRVLILLSIEGIIAFSLLEALGCLPALKERLQCALLLFLALFIRLCFFDKVNTDYEWFLKVWVNYFRENGGIKGLGQSLGNYNVPYMVFLSLFSYSSVSDLYLIKLLSIFFDIILAFASALLAVRCGGSRKNQLITFFAVMFLPTVVLNSAYWGQCDSIYVSFALLGIAAALPDEKGKGHPALSVICIAVSFSFKLQAVFLMPVWIVIWGWRKYRYSWIALFPATYLILMLPAVLAGRSLREVLLFYVDQADTVGSALNYNAPSLTAFFKNVSSPEGITQLLIVFAFAAMALIILTAVFFRKKLNAQLLLVLSGLMSTAIPFFLPHMHDRYFFAADVISLILAVSETAFLPAALGIQFGSLICYLAYFTGHYQRIGNTSVYLTNDKGAVAVLASLLWISTLFVLKLHQKNKMEKLEDIQHNKKIQRLE